jgi:ABC-type molybdenum transport system ATPase subunit/photorepair protein PhrA
MLTINDVTVRLGGRTILDHASASVPTGPRWACGAQRGGQVRW